MANTKQGKRSKPEPVLSHQAYFDLDIPRAIKLQLVEAFQQLKAAPIAQVDSLQIRTGGGAYGLYLKQTLVYVGKADKLLDRLLDHRHKLGDRQNISVADVQCVCIEVNPNWSPHVHESILIGHYQDQDLCKWNGMGFGPNDPGRERDTQMPSRFDLSFPIRTDLACDWVNTGSYPLLDLVTSLKKKLPYLFRYQTNENGTWKSGHVDFEGKKVTVEAPAMAARELLQLVAKALPDWKLVLLPGYVVLYQDTEWKAPKHSHWEVL